MTPEKPENMNWVKLQQYLQNLKDSGNVDGIIMILPFKSDAKISRMARIDLTQILKNG